MRWLKLTTASALTVGFLLSSSVVAVASDEQAISGIVECNDGVIQGVFVHAEDSSDSGWAQWDVPVRAGGHDEAEFQFTLDNGGQYRISAGCNDVSQLFSDDWGTTVESGWVSSDAHPKYYCNALEEWKLWGIGWIKWFKAAYEATDPPAYGECVQVATAPAPQETPPEQTQPYHEPQSVEPDGASEDQYTSASEDQYAQ